MNIKIKILSKTIILFLITWLFFFSYLYSELQSGLLKEYQIKGESNSERLFRMINDSGKSLINISDNISHIVFESHNKPLRSLDDLKQRIDYAWSIFNDQHDLLSMYLYNDRNSLLFQYGHVDDEFLHQASIDNAFEEREGIIFFSCRDICYINSGKAINPNSFRYGVLRINLPLFSILDDFAILKKSDVVIYKNDPLSDNANRFLNAYYEEMESNNSVEIKLGIHDLPVDAKKNTIYLIEKSDRFFSAYVDFSPINKDFLFLIYEDVTEVLKKNEKSFYHIISISLAVMLVLLVILYFTLNQVISRLQSLVQVFPYLGVGRFSEAEQKIEMIPGARKKSHDELDMLHYSTKKLAKELKGLHQSLNVQNQELRILADYDSMTGVFNRRKFKERLAFAHQEKNPFFLISFDLDHFKLVNDTLGHTEGDNLLILFTLTLKKHFPEKSVIGRMGGDEFSIICQGNNKNHLKSILDEIIKETSKIKLKSLAIQFLQVRPSIGIAHYPDDTSSLEKLTTYADVSMYENKGDNKKKYNFYTGMESMLILEKKMTAEVNRINNAIENQLIHPHYQVIVSSLDQTIFSYEVLSKIWDPDEEIYHSAEKFITYAEKTHSIVQIDIMMLDASLKAACQLTPMPSLMLNFSSITLSVPDIHKVIIDTIIKYQYDFDKITLEITESTKIDNVKQTKELIKRLHKKGVKFALDDFGSGYASFRYINELSFDYIKIDKDIIMGLTKDPKNTLNHKIIESIAFIAKDSNTKVIAEGIETQETFSVVRNFNVDLMQGYLFSKPDLNFLQTH